MLPLVENFVTKIKRIINKAPFKKKKEHVALPDNYAKYQDLQPKQADRNLKYGLGFIVLSCVIVIIYLLLSVVIAVYQYNPKEFPNTKKDITSLSTDENKKTILIIALDRVDDNHLFVDGLAVLNYDYISKKTAIFTVNSDLKVYSNILEKDVVIRTAFNDINDKSIQVSVMTNLVETLLSLKIDNYVIIDLQTFNKVSKYVPLFKMQLDRPLKDPDTVTLPNKEYKEWGGGEQFIKGGDLIEFLASNNNGRDEQLNRQGYTMKNLMENITNVAFLSNIPKIIQELDTSYFYTDLTKEQMLIFLWNLSQTRDSDFKIGYTKSSTYTNIHAVSYYSVYIPNYVLLDQDVSSVFADLNIFREQARIELLNGSSVLGLASNRARWISNAGGVIIKVGNSYENEKTTKIYCANYKNFPYTIKEIQRIFDYNVQLITKDYTGRHVGDIVVVIGDSH